MSPLNAKAGATRALLAAALGGFLSSAVACGAAGHAANDSDSQADSSERGTTDTTVASESTTGAPLVDTGAALSDAAVVSSDAAIVSTNPHTPIPATKCESGQVAHPGVTSTALVALTQEEFASRCAERNGIFEIQPLCGGANSCRGLSYDSDSQTLTEHSCQATNTCAGYSCVVCT